MTTKRLAPFAPFTLFAPFVLPLFALSGAHCGGGTATVRPTSPEPPEAATPASPEPTFPDANMERSEVPDRYKWNLSALFPDDAAFERSLEEVGGLREQLQACSGSLSDPVRLEACLTLYFRTRLLTNRLTLFASLQGSTDQESSEVQARVERSQSAMADLMAIAATQRTEILGLPERQLTRAFERRPALKELRPYVEQMRRRRDRVLGSETERVLSLAGDNLWAEIDLNELPSDHERAFTALLSQLPLPEISDESGESVQLALSNYGKYRGSSERSVRQAAVEGLFGALREFDQTFASLLAGQARYTVFLARSRGYDTALDAYLHKDDVDPDIYRNLVRTIEDNLAPLHRYMRLRKERMGLEEMHIYDLYVPLVPNVEKTIRYERAVEIVREALEPLGEEYGGVLATGLDPANGWIDVFPHKRKESGAFSASVFGTHPFVFMNYFEETEDMLTLAHEYGHALHTHYTMENQPYVTSNYVPMIAETASTFNEVLVIRRMIEDAEDDDERLYLLGKLVEMIRTTIYRQTLFESFELAVHTAVEQGVPVTADYLDELYSSLVRKYYGDALTLGENDGMEWAYVPHFYFKYYMYAYAMGLSAGIALGDRVLGGGAEERDAYLRMLSAGSARPPRELLRDAGVDPGDPGIVEAAARLMDESVGRMEEILARRPREG